MIRRQHHTEHLERIAYYGLLPALLLDLLALAVLLLASGHHTTLGCACLSLASLLVFTWLDYRYPLPSLA